MSRPPWGNDLLGLFRGLSRIGSAAAEIRTEEVTKAWATSSLRPIVSKGASGLQETITKALQDPQIFQANVANTTTEAFSQISLVAEGIKAYRTQTAPISKADFSESAQEVYDPLYDPNIQELSIEELMLHEAMTGHENHPVPPGSEPGVEILAGIGDITDAAVTNIGQVKSSVSKRLEGFEPLIDASQYKEKEITEAHVQALQEKLQEMEGAAFGYNSVGSFKDAGSTELIDEIMDDCTAGAVPVEQASNKASTADALEEGSNVQELSVEDVMMQEALSSHENLTVPAGSITESSSLDSESGSEANKKIEQFDQLIESLQVEEREITSEHLQAVSDKLDEIQNISFGHDLRMFSDADKETVQGESESSQGKAEQSSTIIENVHKDLEKEFTNTLSDKENVALELDNAIKQFAKSVDSTVSDKTVQDFDVEVPIEKPADLKFVDTKVELPNPQTDFPGPKSPLNVLDASPILAGAGIAAAGVSGAAVAAASIPGIGAAAAVVGGVIASSKYLENECPAEIDESKVQDEAHTSVATKPTSPTSAANEAPVSVGTNSAAESPDLVTVTESGHESVSAQMEESPLETISAKKESEDELSSVCHESPEIVLSETVSTTEVPSVQESASSQVSESHMEDISSVEKFENTSSSLHASIASDSQTDPSTITEEAVIVESPETDLSMSVKSDAEPVQPLDTADKAASASVTTEIISEVTESSVQATLGPDSHPDGSASELVLMQDTVSSTEVSSAENTSEVLSSAESSSEPVSSAEITSEAVSSAESTAEALSLAESSSEPVSSAEITSEAVSSAEITSEAVSSAESTSDGSVSSESTKEPVSSVEISSETIPSAAVLSEKNSDKDVDEHVNKESPKQVASSVVPDSVFQEIGGPEIKVSAEDVKIESEPILSKESESIAADAKVTTAATEDKEKTELANEANAPGYKEDIDSVLGVANASAAVVAGTAAALGASATLNPPVSASTSTTTADTVTPPATSQSSKSAPSGLDKKSAPAAKPKPKLLGRKPLAKDKPKSTLAENAQARKVPHSRFGRMLTFGSLAAGLGAGTIAEMTRRTLGVNQGKGSGSLLDASPFLTEANAKRIVDTLCKVRGAALKLGQMLSIQDSALINPQVQKIFERVRQSADFMPAWQLEKAIIEQLGDDWRSKVTYFDDKPFAAASIGQVHLVKLLDGRSAAMKIQYPGVAAGIESDINNLMSTLKVANIIPEGLYVDSVIDVAKRELGWECDYKREAVCTEQYRQLVKQYPEFYVPEIVPDLCTEQIFTSELIEGVPVDKCVEMDQETRNYIGEKIIRLCLLELFRFGFMQTDPNWSNFFYNADTEQLALLDFGACRSYDKSFVDKYIHIIHGAATKDRGKVLQYSQELGFLTGHEAKVMVDAHIDAIMILGEAFQEDKPFQFGAQDTTHRIQHLVPVMLSHRMCAPPEESYSLHRKMSGVFLLCAKLNSSFNCRPLFEEVFDGYKFGGTWKEFHESLGM